MKVILYQWLGNFEIQSISTTSYPNKSTLGFLRLRLEQVTFLRGWRGYAFSITEPGSCCLICELWRSKWTVYVSTAWEAKLLCSTQSLEEPNLVHGCPALDQELPFKNFSLGFSRPCWRVIFVLRCVTVLKILWFWFISVYILALCSEYSLLTQKPSECRYWALVGNWLKLCPIKDEREKSLSVWCSCKYKA